MKTYSEWVTELGQVNKCELNSKSERVIMDLYYSVYEDVLSLIEDCGAYEDNALEVLTEAIQAKMVEIEDL